MGELDKKAFEVLSRDEVASKLIDKLSDAIGWVAIPKGNHKNNLIAQEYLIQKIKEDENIPDIAKAALISNVKKIIKEYINQNDIFNKACEYLDEKSNPENLKDDWVCCFLDNCKYANSDYIKQIWARLLATECNYFNSIPKKLIYILASISPENAFAYTKLCKFALSIPLVEERDYNELFIFWRKNEEYFRENGINYGKLLELESIGLVNIDMDDGFYISHEDIKQIDGKVAIGYNDRVISISNMKKKLNVGNVVFTNAGVALYRIIAPETTDNAFEYFDYELSKQGLTVSILKF